MITLSPRLAAVAAYVLPGEPLADIGTDHAYLPGYLIQAGAVPRAVAGDVVPGPLEAARATICSEGLGEQVELRLGSGLRVLQPGEAGTVTICGMGGPLIAEILAAGPLEGISRLVLQPMGGEERLREWLAEYGWRIVAESLVADSGRIYVVMAAEPGAMELDEADRVVGPCVRHQGGRLLAQYAGALLGQARRALAMGPADPRQRPEAAERSRTLADRIKLLEEVIRDAESDRR